MIRDTSAQDRVIAPRTGRHRQLMLIGGGVALVAALALSWPAVQRLFSANASVSETRLSFAPVETGPFVRDISGEGKVVAANAPTLYAPNAGAVTIRVHAGDKVAKGQVLADIESADLANRLAQERSNADAMQADLMRAEVEARQQSAELQSAFENASIDMQAAQTDLDRNQQAFKAGAVAAMQVDRARDTLEKARITLAHASSGRSLKQDSLKFDVQSKRAALERQLTTVKDLQRQVGELAVRSPVDGQVGQLLVAERANVAKDAQLLTVIDLSALEVEMRVAESFARDLAIGMPGDISGNGRSWKGLISSVSPEVVNGEVAARLRFDGATPDQLRQNQRLTVRVLLDQRDKVLSVRRGSFADENGGTAAYVLRDGMAERVPVRLGARSLDKVEVLEGLKAGDRVVISGADAFNGAPRVAISR